MEMIQANWLVFVLALVLGLIVAWWIFARGSRGEEPRERKPDVLDEGAERAQRNQALIDSPRAADIQPPPMAGTMAGMGEAIAVAAQDEVEATQARARAVDEPVPPAPPAPSAATDDCDVGRLKGVGPKLVAALSGLGITRIEQIAAWSDEDIDRVDAQLGPFQGRIRRDSWVEQARLLTEGDTSSYETKFGKI